MIYDDSNHTKLLCLIMFFNVLELGIDSTIGCKKIFHLTKYRKKYKHGIEQELTVNLSLIIL